MNRDFVDRFVIELDRATKQRVQVVRRGVIGEPSNRVDILLVTVPAIGPTDGHATRLTKEGIATFTETKHRHCHIHDLSDLVGGTAPIFQRTGIIGDDNQFIRGQVGAKQGSQWNQVNTVAFTGEQTMEGGGGCCISFEDVGNVTHGAFGRFSAQGVVQAKRTGQMGWYDVSPLGRSKAKEERAIPSPPADTDGRVKAEGDRVARLGGSDGLNIAQAAFGHDEDLLWFAVAVVVERRDRAKVDLHGGHTGSGGDANGIAQVDAIEVRVKSGPDGPRFPRRPEPGLEERITRGRWW